MEDDQPLPKKKKILNELEKDEKEPEDLAVKKGKDDDEKEEPKDLAVKKDVDPKAGKNGSDSDHKDESKDDVDEDEDDDKDEEDEPERIDKEGDRNYNDKLVGEKIRGNYDNGWHTGTIQWFNTEFLEYRVLFEDGSEDYISTDDIDGVDIVLVPSQKFKNSNSNKGGRAKSPLVRDDSDSDYSDESEDEPTPKKRTNNVKAAKKPAGKSSKPESSRTPTCPEVDDVYERMKEMHEDDSESEEDEDDD